MSDLKKRKIGIFLYPLRGGDTTLSGYQFCDLNHARGWLSQEYVGLRYTISIKSYTRRKCCGEPTNLRIIKRFTAKEFIDFSVKELKNILKGEPA